MNNTPEHKHEVNTPVETTDNTPVNPEVVAQAGAAKTAEHLAQAPGATPAIAEAIGTNPGPTEAGIRGALDKQPVDKEANPEDTKPSTAERTQGVAQRTGLAEEFIEKMFENVNLGVKDGENFVEALFRILGEMGLDLNFTKSVVDNEGQEIADIAESSNEALNREITGEDMRFLISRSSPNLRNAADKIHNTSKQIKNMSLVVLRRFPNLRISSGTRTESHNRRVNGAADSDHIYGQAIDFVPPSAAAKRFIQTQFPGSFWSDNHDRGSGPHLHVSYRPGGQKITGRHLRIARLKSYKEEDYA